MGSWTEAWAAAGFPVPAACRRSRAARWTPRRVAAALRQAAAAGQVMTLRAWDRAGRRPSSATVRHVFGSWAAALRAAGVPAPAAVQRAAWEAAYARLATRLGRAPRRADWDAWPERPTSARRAWATCGWPPGEAPQQATWRSVDLARIPDPVTRGWARQYRDGQSLAAIARSAGVTRQWVQQKLRDAATRWARCQPPALAAWARRHVAQARDPVTRRVLAALAAGEAPEVAAARAGCEAAAVWAWLWRQVGRPTRLTPLPCRPIQEEAHSA
jgi:hypothetical protein